MTAGNCDHTRKVSDYLSGALSSAEAVEFEGHLNTCGTCTLSLSQTLESPDEPDWLRLLRASAISPPAESVESRVDRDNRYVRVRMAGSGGMSVVWEGWDRTAQRPVALKYLHARNSSVPGLQRLLQEATALRRLEHPHIVGVYELVASAPEPVLVMEYVEGMTLSRWQQGQPVSPRDATEITLVMATALQHAHERGVIHRDLKPSNILLQTQSPRMLPRDDRGTPLVKLSDFGLAKISGDRSLTITGEKPGTPAYMAPEQVCDGGRSSVASDIYAAGVLLYELLTGRPPFIASDAGVVLLLIQASDPTPPRLLLPVLSAELETICLKCLSRQPEDRYGTASELAHDLQAFLCGRPISARPPGPLVIFRKWARRNRMLAALLISTIVGLSATCLLSLVALNRHIASRDLAEQANVLAELTAKKERELRERAEQAETNASERAELEAALRARHQDVLLKVIALADSSLRTAAQNTPARIASPGANPAVGTAAGTNSSPGLLNADYLATEVLRDYVLFLADSSRPLDWNDLELTIRYLAFRNFAGSYEDVNAALARADEALDIFESNPRDPLQFVEFVRIRQLFFSFDLPQSEVLQETYLTWMRIAGQFLQQAHALPAGERRMTALLAAREQALMEAHNTASIMQQIPTVAPTSVISALDQLGRALRQPLPHAQRPSPAALALQLYTDCDMAGVAEKAGDHDAAKKSLESAREFLDQQRHHIPPGIVLQVEQRIRSLTQPSNDNGSPGKSAP